MYFEKSSSQSLLLVFITHPSCRQRRAIAASPPSSASSPANSQHGKPAPQLQGGPQHPKLKLQQTTALKSIKSLAPLLDRVLVQRVKAEAKTAGGLFLPETAVKELNEAKVLAVGPGLVTKEGSRIPMSVHQGDKVLIPQVC